MNLHQKANFLFIALAKCFHMFSSHCDQFISLLCPILTHCDPRKSSIFPIFVIFVIYRPRFCPFVHFVIVLYCIYAFWDVNIISVIVLYIALYIALFDFVIALYIALRGTCREYTLVYGSTCWGMSLNALKNTKKRNSPLKMPPSSVSQSITMRRQQPASYWAS